MNIFKWFQTTPNQQENPDQLDSKWHNDDSIDAAIIYYVQKDGETCVDIEISDYEDDTIDNFYRLLTTIGNDEVFIETLEIVKQGFLDAEREDLFIKLTKQLSLEFIQKSEEEPCLKPSDVL